MHIVSVGLRGEMAEKQLAERIDVSYKRYKTVRPGWNNEPRLHGQGMTFFKSSPESYREWLARTCKCVMQDTDKEKHIVFINT